MAAIQADARALPLRDQSVHCVSVIGVTIFTSGIIWVMPDKRGRFIKGEHWRPHQSFRDADWLTEEYVAKQRSCSEIASDFGVTHNAIHFWLKRHGIPTRSVAESRAVKHWGAEGEANPMFGRSGADNPNWKGGASPDRQGFYSSREWGVAVKAVWARDQARCQRCGCAAQERGSFHIHHIVSFAVKELRTKPSNLVLLCAECHWWVHSLSNSDGLFLVKGGDAEWVR